MKLGPLIDIEKSLAHALFNKAGGRIGFFFQFYVLLWTVLSSYLITSRILSIDENPDLISLAIVPIYVLLLYVPIYIFWIYEKKTGIEKRRIKEMQVVDSVNVEYKFAESVELGFNTMLFLRVNNPSEKLIENIWIRAVFPASVRCDKPILSLGSLEPESSLCSSLSFVPLLAGTLSMGYYDLYFEIKDNKHQKPPIFFENLKVQHSYVGLDFELLEPLRFGHMSTISIKIINRSNTNLDNLHVKSAFSKEVNYDTAFSDSKIMTPGSSFHVTYQITPISSGTIDLGEFDVMFNIGGNDCKIGPVALGEYNVQVPDIDVKINIPETLYSEVGNTIGIYVENKSDEIVSNVCFNSCFSSFIECKVPGICIPEIQPHSSRYGSITMKPASSGKMDLGNLNFSFEVNDTVLQKEPIVLGTYNVS